MKHEVCDGTGTLCVGKEIDVFCRGRVGDAGNRDEELSQVPEPYAKRVENNKRDNK
jgi:hypothetical protein